MLGDLVREREVIKRKLLTTYSLGRDKAESKSSEKSLLPLYSVDGKRSKSLSLRGLTKERATIFHTLSDDNSSLERSSSSSETSWESFHEEHDSETREEAKEIQEAGLSAGGVSEMRSPFEIGSSSRTSSSLTLKKRKVLS